MKFRKGDKVKIVPEWLGKNEEAGEVYIVREDSIPTENNPDGIEHDRIDISAVSLMDWPIVPCERVRLDMIEKLED